jgi:hypothetical protein
MNIHSNKIKLSDVSLGNVEALAQESDIPQCVQAKGFCVDIFVEYDYLAFK